MTEPSRIAKRLLAPALVGATLFAVQAVVASPPTATFGVSAQQPGGCGTFTFTEESTDLENDIQTLVWDFGDGTTAPGASGVDVTKTYESAVPAARIVTLTATDADTDPDGELGPEPGDGVETDTQTATVTIANTPPSASFAAPANAQLGQVVTVQGSGADPDGVSFAWDVDGDGFDDDLDGAIALDYAATTATPGQKTVRLQVTDGCDVTTVHQETFFVTNPPPTASFTVTPSSGVGVSAIQAGESVTITSTSTDQTGGTVEHFQWDLNNNGDYNEGGATGEVDAPSVSTAFAAGTVPIRLIVTDEHGATDDAVDFVGVSDLPRPIPGFTFSPENPLPGQTVTLRSTSSISTAAGARPLDRVEWDFDHPASGAFTADAGGGSVSTSFATPGPKTVALRAFDTAGGFATFAAPIVVNAAPQASFTTAPRKPVEGNEVTFASTSTDPDGPLAKQEWDLDGDNKFDDAQGAVATTRKLKRGNRTVRLRVTDAKGASVVSAKVVPVKAKPLKEPVDVKRSLGYVRHSWGVELVVLIVKVPSKTTVTVKCNGRGCPRGALKKRSKRNKGAVLRFTRLKGSVRAGAKIAVITSRTGHITAYDTYRVRGGGRSPLLREGCKPPGAKRARALRAC